ncbi:MAG TPA: RIP metalloprotease RseP [Thermoanaerobaculia bacterium]|nr:RIP metalloprotease RseP [Thermoanaerobaculia bacterium]
MTELLANAQGLLTSLLAFAFALGVIIAVHEWGHLIVAKLFDVRVHAFSLGFGPRIWGFQRGETEYRLSAVPLGGYVKLGGEQPDEATGDPREFLSKPRWQRILVYLAGPAMNIILALLMMAGLFMVGIEVPDLSVAPEIDRVQAGSSGEAAGLQQGDLVLAVDGREIDTWNDFILDLQTHRNKPLDLTVERDGETFEATVTPGPLEGGDGTDNAGLLWKSFVTLNAVEAGRPADEAGLKAGDKVDRVDGQLVTGIQDFVDRINARAGEPVELAILRGDRQLDVTVTPEGAEGAGLIGVSVGGGLYQRYGFVDACIRSARFNWNVVDQTFGILGRIATGKASARDNLAGPIQIAKYSGEAASRGLDDLILLMALISVSIAILNLLPIPVLDGGQITILLVESAMRRDLSLKLKEYIAIGGFAIIVVLMLAVIYIDVSKVLPGGN